MYSPHTIYIIGDAKAPNNNPITQKFNAFFIGLVVDLNNGKIVDADCSSTIELTSQFVRSLLINEHIQNAETIIHKIETRYFGSSQKGLIVAYKDALKKYQQIINK
ncbi:DUF3870 domain-containing protein [Bacillus aquiflavi]|uniref:DUF3870 domain-containing protein n=1 Tax=Bacillus aquiflavi TaxID=2672567 RepID=A0A6B3VZG2_9BACI|nr:DUF3870 domain-containing protein [Bacillus aquiflavi]MBA4536366.1 DUF3870 domain-containing protein [Bacillus aquiflavi]NEY80734.1 DUF3870 domain-containing protein [Bacillus aquiflavi]UAC48060.1 DUF3870 domain-containing protein [Bacillus aquiflavi]